MDRKVEVVSVTTHAILNEFINSHTFIMQWEGLLKKSVHHTYFQTSHWVLSYLKVYRDKFDPFLIVVYRDDEMVGLAPFAKNKSTGEVSHVFADYCDIVTISGFERIVIRGVLEKLSKEPGVSKFHISQIPEESLLPNLIDEVTVELGYKSVKTLPLPSFSNICNREWLESFMRKKSIKYCFNHYNREGKFELVRINSKELYDRYFDMFKKQLIVRQLVGDRQVAFDDPFKEKFHLALFEDPAGAKLIDFTVLLSKNRPIAFHYGYRYNDILYWGAPSIDMEDDRYSPGVVMFLKHISNGLETGLKAIDLTVGHQWYKVRFSNTQRETHGRIVYFSLFLYIKETLWRMPRRLLRQLFELLGVKYESRKRIKGILGDVRSLANIRTVLSKIPQLLGNLDGIRVFEINKKGYGTAVQNLKLITAKEKVIVKEGHLTDLLDLNLVGMKKERYQLMDDAIQNIKGGSKLYVSYKEQSAIGYAWIKEVEEVNKRPVHFGKIKLEGNSSVIHGIVSVEKNEMGAKMIISNLTVDLFELGKEKVVLVLDKDTMTNEKEIEGIGYSKLVPKSE